MYQILIIILTVLFAYHFHQTYVQHDNETKIKVNPITGQQSQANSMAPGNQGGAPDGHQAQPAGLPGAFGVPSDLAASLPGHADNAQFVGGHICAAKIAGAPENQAQSQKHNKVGEQFLHYQQNLVAAPVNHQAVHNNFAIMLGNNQVYAPNNQGQQYKEKL